MARPSKDFVGQSGSHQPGNSQANIFRSDCASLMELMMDFFATFLGSIRVGLE